MQSIILPGTDLACSRFIFGTASLFTVGSLPKRLALLEAAIDHGFTHFDTAPYYGFGMAERDLGRVLQRHPQMTVSTKVGIYSPGGEQQSYAAIFLRKVAGKLVPAVTRPTISFDLARAIAALEGSLRRLQRERVELYLLHEPELHLLQTEEWQRWLEDLQRAGRIGTFGFALSAGKLPPLLREAAALAPVVQMPDSLDCKEADLLGQFGKPMQITYAYVSAALRRGDSRPVGHILQQALARNPAGAIIVSTSKVARLAQYADLVDAQ